MNKIVRHVPDKGLGKPKQRFEDTFSAWTIVKEYFFSKKGR